MRVGISGALHMNQIWISDRRLVQVLEYSICRERLFPGSPSPH